MNILSVKTHPWTVAVLSLGLLFARESAVATAPTSTTQSSPQTPVQGFGAGMMGPGMMYNWTPEQRQQRWEQMRKMGYGPGMMYNASPEKRRQHWQQMGQMMGYAPGMMMESPVTSLPQKSGQ